jgi:hypothetical protein
VRSRHIVRLNEAGFLENLADDAAGDVNPAAADVVKIGRAGRKIDSPGIGGMRRHLAQQECAVRCA